MLVENKYYQFKKNLFDILQTLYKEMISIFYPARRPRFLPFRYQFNLIPERGGLHHLQEKKTSGPCYLCKALHSGKGSIASSEDASEKVKNFKAMLEEKKSQSSFFIDDDYCIICYLCGDQCPGDSSSQGKI